MSSDRKLGHRLSSMFRRDATPDLSPPIGSRAYDVIIPAPRSASASSPIRPTSPSTQPLPVGSRASLGRPTAARRAPPPIDTDVGAGSFAKSPSRRSDNRMPSEWPANNPLPPMDRSHHSNNVSPSVLPGKRHNGQYPQNMALAYPQASLSDRPDPQWDHSQPPNWLDKTPVASAIDSLVDDIEGYFLDTRSGQQSGLSTQPQSPTLPYRPNIPSRTAPQTLLGAREASAYPASGHSSYLRMESGSFLDPYDPSSPQTIMSTYRDIFPTSPTPEAHNDAEYKADIDKAPQIQQAEELAGPHHSPIQKLRPYFESLPPSPVQKSRPYLESHPPSPVQDIRPYAGDPRSYPESHDRASAQNAQAASPSRSYRSSHDDQHSRASEAYPDHQPHSTDLGDYDFNPDVAQSDQVSGTQSMKSASYSDANSRHFLTSSDLRFDAYDLLSQMPQVALEPCSNEPAQSRRSAYEHLHDFQLPEGINAEPHAAAYEEHLMLPDILDTNGASHSRNLIPTSNRTEDQRSIDAYGQGHNVSTTFRNSQESNFSAGTHYKNSRHLDPVVPTTSPSLMRTPEQPSPVFRDLWDNNQETDRVPKSLKAAWTPTRANYDSNSRTSSQASAPRHLLRHVRQLSSMSLIYSTGSFRNVSLGSLKRNLSLKPGEGERSHYVTAVRRAAGTANNDTGPGKWKLPTGILPIDRASTYSNDRFIRLAGALLLSSGRGKKTSGVELKHGHLAPRLLAAEVEEGGGSLIGKRIENLPAQPVTPKLNDTIPETPKLSAPSFSPVPEEALDKRHRLESISSTQSASLDITGYYQHPLYRVESDKTIEEQTQVQPRPLKLANPDGLS